MSLLASEKIREPFVLSLIILTVTCLLNFTRSHVKQAFSNHNRQDRISFKVKLFVQDHTTCKKSEVTMSAFNSSRFLWNLVSKFKELNNSNNSYYFQPLHQLLSFKLQTWYQNCSLACFSWWTPLGIPLWSLSGCVRPSPTVCEPLVISQNFSKQTSADSACLIPDHWPSKTAFNDAKMTHEHTSQQWLSILMLVGFQGQMTLSVCVQWVHSSRTKQARPGSNRVYLL